MNQAPNNFSITTAHHGVFEDVSKSILSSLIGSMNFRAVAYARLHLRLSAIEQTHKAREQAGYKRITADDIPNVDDRNDADAAIAEAANRAAAAPDFGFNIQMPASELASTMMVMRDFFAERVYAIGIKSQRDKPGSIAETIQYQLDRGINNEAENKAKAIAEALDIDPEMMSAAMLEDHTRDVNDLRIHAGKVIGYLDTMGGVEISEATVEHLFDALPAQVQYKIIAKVIQVYEKQAKQQLIKVLRGNGDAATNYKLLQAKRSEAVTWLTTFSKAKRLELNEYMDRGGELPEFSDTIVDSNDTHREAPVSQRMIESTQAAIARKSEDAAALSDKLLKQHVERGLVTQAEVDAVSREPKVIGKAQRAPKKEKA